MFSVGYPIRLETFSFRQWAEGLSVPTSSSAFRQAPCRVLFWPRAESNENQVVMKRRQWGGWMGGMGILVEMGNL